MSNLRLSDRRIAIVVEDVDGDPTDVEARIRARIDLGASRFWVVVPVQAPKVEPAWTFLDIVRYADEATLTPAQLQRFREALHESSLRYREELEVAWWRAELRLGATCDAIRAAGAAADGVIVNGSARSSLQGAFRDQHVSEVILHARRTWVPRLMRIDPLARTLRALDAPVTTVTGAGVPTTPVSTAAPDDRDVRRAA